MKEITLLLIIVCSIVSGCSSTKGKILKPDVASIPETTHVDDPPTVKLKSNEFEEVKPREGVSAASLLSAAPRHFIDLFFGTATTLDGDVSAPSHIANTQSVSRNVQFRSSALFGIRVGTWLENYPYFGLAGEVSYFQANASTVSIWYVPISFLVMGRYPFLRTDTVPDGRLQLYGGALVSLIGPGDIEVDFTPETANKAGNIAVGTGVGVLLGIKWCLPSYALFSEFRLKQDNMEFRQIGLYGEAPESVSADLESRQLLFGVSFRY
jgi:hypothetical protein